MSISVRRCLIVIVLASLCVGKGFAGTPSFVSAENFRVGPAPTAVAVGDVNDDGFPDAVVTNFGGGTISILLGTAKGGFQPTRTMTVGSSPSAIAAADFNGDGKLDLAVTVSSNSGGVVVLLGNGDGTFTASSQGEIEIAGSHSVAVADFNLDGKADLMIAGNKTLTVLLGNGDGTFQTSSTIVTGHSATQIVTADFNNDGKADVAVTEYSGNAIVVLLGKGDGTFGHARPVPVGLNPTNLAVGDFNRDGRMDLVVDERGNSVSVLLGNGDGTFQPPASYPVVTSTSSFAVADLNGDGIPDIAVADSAGFDVVILLGNGDGTFRSLPSNYAVGANPSAIATAKFSGDNQTDLLTVDAGSGSVTLVRQVSRGFLAAPSYSVPFQPISIAAGDFTSDGLADIAVLSDIANQIVILPNSAAGFLAPIVTPLPFDAQFGTIEVGDLNGDGKLDLVVSSTNYLEIFLGNGDGTFQPPTAIALPAFVTDIVVADFNGDGKLDVAVTEQGLGGFEGGQVMLGNGDGTFQTPIKFWAGPYPFALAYGDFNGDGKLDLAVVDQYANTQGDNYVYVLLGNGDGSFQANMQFPAGVSATALVVGDFNSDGRQDILVGSYLSPRLELLPGHGDGTFAAPVRINEPDVAYTLVAGDFNGDGKLDVAVGGANVDVLLGNGDGTFPSGQRYFTNGPDSLVPGRFGSGAALDLAIAANVGNVMVLYSTGAP